MSEAQSPEGLTDIEELAAKTQKIVDRAMMHELAAEGKYCPMCWKDITPEELDDPDSTYREVVSWVTGPKSQSPVLRGQTGRIAHKTCVEKVLNGQSPDQESIPGLEL